MHNDKDIIKAVQADPEHGFRLLLKRYSEPVYWHIRRLVVAHDDAQDTSQETFVRVFCHFRQYDSKQSFKAWVFKIATNEALRLLGKRSGKVMVSLDDTPEETLNMKADEYFDYSDALSVKLQQAVHALPVKQQLAFNMRYYDELSYKEIAAVTGFTAANVKMNYHVAKEKIVKFMKSNI